MTNSVKELYTINFLVSIEILLDILILDKSFMVINISSMINYYNDF